MVGMQLERREDGLFIHQRQYAEQIKERFPDVGTREEATPATTEKDPEIETTLDQQSTQQFRAKVGSLMYLSCGTRPDIAQAVNVCSRKMSAPNENDRESGEVSLPHLVRRGGNVVERTTYGVYYCCRVLY